MNRKLITMAVCAAMTATGASAGAGLAEVLGITAADGGIDAPHLWKLCTYEEAEGESEIVLFWERGMTAKIKFEFWTDYGMDLEFVLDRPHIDSSPRLRTTIERDGYHLTWTYTEAEFDRQGNLKGVSEEVFEGDVVCDS